MFDVNFSTEKTSNDGTRIGKRQDLVEINLKTILDGIFLRNEKDEYYQFDENYSIHQQTNNIGSIS